MIVKKYALWTITLVFILLQAACSSPKGIYIDIRKGAIVSCDGMGIKEITISSDCNDVKEVRLEGTSSVIYFNQKNPVSRTSIYGDVVDNYILELKTNCSYKITKYMGHDRGNFTVTFKTNRLAKVVEASDTECR